MGSKVAKRKATFNREVKAGKYIYTPVNKRAKSLGVSGRKSEVKKSNGGKFKLYYYAKDGSLREVKV